MQACEEVVDVFAEVVGVLVLRTGELLLQELSRVLPVWSFLSEDAIAKKGMEDVAAEAEAEICSQKRQLAQVRKLAGTGLVPWKLLDRRHSTFFGCRVWNTRGPNSMY